jgi:hypothetical protein
MTNTVTKSDTEAAAPQSAIAKEAAWSGIQLAQQAFDYWTDAWQRSVLFLDVLTLRIDQERAIAAVPKLLLADSAEQETVLGVIRPVASAAGEPVGEIKARLALKKYSTAEPRSAANSGKPLLSAQEQRCAA